MSSHIPFEYLNISYGRKKSQGSKCQFNSRSLKVRNRPDLFALRACGVPHIVGKLSTRAINFLETSPQSEVWKRNYGPPKSWKSQFWEFRDFQLESPRTKWHLGAGPVAMHWKYYKGEGGGFPQVRAAVNLISLCMPMACPCTKSLPTTH
jgi:hypothetical protein